MNRRKFIKNSLIGLGCIVLPINLIKTKTLKFTHQFHVSFIVPASDMKDSKKIYIERYLKPALTVLENQYKKYKRKGYTSFNKNSIKYLKEEEVEYFKYNKMYIRYITKLYNIEYDTHIARLDIFMGKYI